MLNVNGRGYRAGALTVLLIATAQASPAAAQGTAGDDSPAVRSPTVGSVQGRGFHITASVRSLYDSNILRLGKGIAPSPGRSRDDFRITPRVELAYGLPIGRQQLFLGGDFGKDFYVKNTRLSKTRYGVGGGLIWKLARSCAGSISGDYRRRQSLLSESSVRRDNTQEIQDYYAGGDCAPPTGLGFGGSVTRGVTNNANPDRRVQDVREMTYDAHLNFGAPALGQFSLGGVYSHYDYPERSLFVPISGGGIDQVADKLDLYQARLSYSRAIGTRFSISASGSYIKLKPDPRDVANIVQLPDGTLAFIVNPRSGYSGPGYTLSVGYHPTARLNASLAASHNVTSSPNVAARFTVRDSVSTEINYRLSPSIDTTLGGSWDRRQFKGSFATAEEPLPRTNDSIARIYARAGYSPRPRYSLDLEVGHQWRSSTPSIYNFNSTSVALTARVNFGRG